MRNRRRVSAPKGWLRHRKRINRSVSISMQFELSNNYNTNDRASRLPACAMGIDSCVTISWESMASPRDFFDTFHVTKSSLRERIPLELCRKESITCSLGFAVANGISIHGKDEILKYIQPEGSMTRRVHEVSFGLRT